MPSPDLYKKALYFVIFAGIITLVLILLPIVEETIKGYVLSQFGLAISPDGSVVSSDGEAPTMMTMTTVGLIVNLIRLAKILLWMALIISIVRFLGYFILKAALRNSNQSEISSLVKTVISIIVYIVAFFIIFQSQYPNVQLAPLFTGSTILGIVVGLALQDTLGNLFAGIALQADQAFQVGDVISISNKNGGVVESVSWRGVKIRTFQNKLLVLSNSAMGKETIEVAPRGNLNARLVFFHTLYIESPSRTIQVIREAVRQVENVSPKIRPVVRIMNLAESGIDWEVKYWAEDYTKFNDTDALIRQRIWYVFSREKIGFPYPTRTLHIEKTPLEATLEDFLNTTSERLSNITIFAPLSDEELEKLAGASKVRIYAPGESIVRRGQEGNSMFVVSRGSVEVQILVGSDIKTINTLKESDYFGEMSLLTGEPRTATVVAVEETEVVQINKSALKPIFEGNPDLVKSICELIEERRLLLSTDVGESEKDEKKQDRGVLISIIKFFGLK